MLRAASRMRDGAEFSAAVRGARAGTRLLVVHATTQADPSTNPPTRVGFVVSRAVGNAVVRSRVKRRLRANARDLLADTPRGLLVVVRALPAAGFDGGNAPELTEALAGAWERAVAKVSR